MTHEDIAYLRVRAKEELEYSRRAADPALARAHYTLACLYRDRVDLAGART